MTDMNKRTPTAEDRLKIYTDTLRLLRNIEKASKDYRLYTESITKSIEIDIPDFLTPNKQEWNIGYAIDTCHKRIGECIEEKEKEVKK